MQEFSLSTLVFSFLLLAISSAMIFYFFSLLAQNLFGFSPGFFERRALAAKQKKQELLEQASSFSNDFLGAFYFQPVLKDPALPAKIERLHLLLLQKILSLAEESSVRLDHPDTLESLIVDRQPLLRNLMDAQAALRNFRKSRKHTPDWAEQEFENRVKDAAERLNENTGALIKSLERLADQFGRKLHEEEITYH